MGLRTGDHVAALLENRIELFEFAWGCQRIGLHYSPINTHLHEDEILAILADCEPKALLASSALLERMSRLTAAAAAIPAPLRLAAGDSMNGFVSWRTIARHGPAPVIIGETEGQWMLYSSGTTGRPKGVKRRLREVPYGTPAPGERVMASRWSLDRDTVLLSAGPLYHMGPLAFAMGTLRLGGTVVVMARFDAAAALDLIARFDVTHLFMVPTHFARLLGLPPEIKSRAQLGTLKLALHSGAPCPIPLKRQMIDWWGPVLQEFYGATEAIGTCIIDSADWLAHPGSIGRPVSCTVSIRDDAGQPLPPGEAGTVYFSGLAAFSYLNDPDRTAAAYDHGGATVGDIGYLDAEGYLYLTGRSGDLIISGGVNVSPAEAEAALATHEAVADCAVAGLADADLGEQVQGFVVLKDAAIASAALAGELIQHCRGRLAHFKCPRGITFLQELPRTESGKLLRRRLRDS